MIRVLVCLIVLVALFAVLITVVEAMGGLIKSPAAALMQAYRCEPQPCWHGIRPGMTTLEQARAVMDADSSFAASLGIYKERCWHVVAAPSWKACFGPLLAAGSELTGYVYLRFISAADAPRLGDALTVMGAPLASKVCFYRLGIEPDGFRPIVGADLYFKNGVYAGAYDPRQPGNFHLNPNMTVFLVSYVHFESYNLNAPRWRGFVNRSGQDTC
jgi:hypothetical protein